MDLFSLERDNSYVSAPLTTKARESLEPSDLVQELCESRGGRPGLSVLTSLLVSVDVRLY